MTEKTFHVYRADDGNWLVKKAGKKPATFPNQDEAVRAARSKADKQRQSQVVVHFEDGTFAVSQIKGLPFVQEPPQKSQLGTAAISRAISDAVRRRLESTV